jgi:small subunit ribosomal protein S14
MPRKSLIVKAQKPQKYSSREYKRCRECGRSRGKVAKLIICRIDFRKSVYRGVLPGWKKV